MFWETGRPFASSQASPRGRRLRRTNRIGWQHVRYAHPSVILAGRTVAHGQRETGSASAFRWCHANSKKVLEGAKGFKLLQAGCMGSTKPLNDGSSRELTRKMRVTQPLKIGYFADGPWSHHALDLFIDDPRFEVLFICARFANPDPHLRFISESLQVDFLVEQDINSQSFISMVREYNCDIFVSMSFDQIFDNLFLIFYLLYIYIISLYEWTKRSHFPNI